MYSLISSLLSNVFFYCHVDNTLIIFYNSLLGGKTYHILYYTKNMIKIFILILHVSDPLAQKNIKKKYCCYYYYY